MRYAALVVISVLLGTLIAWSTIPRLETTVLMLTPPTRWFEVTEFHVEDARVGESPRMRVGRVIRRPVTADRTITVRRILTDGRSTTVCSRHGVRDLMPASVLPPDLTLDHWMTIPPKERCPLLGPGRYRVTTVWQLHIPGAPGKEYRVESNTFEVRP